jgi:uncharacterized protein with NAD-binding domain and iron-sulfur cluster
MKTVAIFGAGVAGLSAAHEFSRLGYNVLVYEANSEPGGFFRSSRKYNANNMPSEYSWHGMGPWYHNVFDILKQIPFDETGSIYDKGLSRPILFGVASDTIRSTSDRTYIFNKPKAFRMNILDKIMLIWLLGKTWTSNRRTQQDYANVNASEQWQFLMSNLGLKTWRATFGPWIGSDWTNVSLHHVGQFFRKNLMSWPEHKHAADERGPAWLHKSRSGWLLFRGPSNEYWFDKWVTYLRTKQVTFFWNTSLYKFDFDGTKITAAYLDNGEKIEADIYVLAVNPFAAVDIIERTPELVQDEQLRLFKPLIKNGPHTQVSFRIGFSEKILWPDKRTGLIIADSEYNLTIFAQEQVWDTHVDLGKDIKSLWTGTACVGKIPGRIYKIPLENCTKEQFIEEIKTQLFNCEELDLLIKQANKRSISSYEIIYIEVWYEWSFSPDGIKPKQSKWVNSTGTQQYQPTQITSIKNLVLAGAHTKTEADLWSIEAAVESGRRAAQAIEPQVNIIGQYKPLLLRIISFFDDIFFMFKLPHILDVFILLMLAAIIMYSLSLKG